MKPKFSIFRRRRPDALLTDRGHGGFAFFAHRHCPATQGSTFSARSARRVREKVLELAADLNSAPNVRTMELSSSRKSEFLILVGRTHPIRSRGLRIGAPFGWSNLRATHINGPYLHCTESSKYSCDGAPLVVAMSIIPEKIDFQKRPPESRTLQAKEDLEVTTRTRHSTV